MAVDVRKWVTFSEEILSEGGRDLEKPLRRVAVAAVLKNPYAGAYSEDISQLIDAGEVLGDELMRRCKAALGDPVEAYGKGGIVGEDGELEHVAAVLHPKFGAPVRGLVDGVSILPSVKKRGARAPTSHPGPPHEGDAGPVALRRDGDLCRRRPGADEIVVAVAVTDGGRPHARVGGLKAEDAIGSDGLH